MTRARLSSTMPLLSMQHPQGGKQVLPSEAEPDKEFLRHRAARLVARLDTLMEQAYSIRNRLFEAEPTPESAGNPSSAAFDPLDWYINLAHTRLDQIEHVMDRISSDL